MRKKILSLITCLFFVHNIFSQKIYTPESVPNPTQTSNGYVSNPDSTLSDDEVVSINAIIAEIKSHTTAQIGLAVIDSIGDDDPESFAVDLFNAWGIGQKDKDNGLLILLVMNPHAWQIKTGYGLEGVLPDAICKRIGDGTMVPFFKSKKYGEGILAGLNEIKKYWKIRNMPMKYGRK